MTAGQEGDRDVWMRNAAAKPDVVVIRRMVAVTKEQEGDGYDVINDSRNFGQSVSIGRDKKSRFLRKR